LAEVEQTTALVLDGVSCGYGLRPVIHDVSITVRKGEVVALIGRNGSGKSTVLKVAFGLLPKLTGRVTFNGLAIEREGPQFRLQHGMAYLPQGRNVFGALSVAENLELARLSGLSKQAYDVALEDILVSLPTLKNLLQFRAATLSGGQRQIVALARTLLSSPQVLLLDEPSLAMSSSLVTWLFAYISKLSQTSKIAILVVEQRVHDILNIADKVYVLRNGIISFAGTAKELSDKSVLNRYFF
jgi:branched-chain amino acid transport system ATP-binding protein